MSHTSSLLYNKQFTFSNGYLSVVIYFKIAAATLYIIKMILKLKLHNKQTINI